MANETLQVIAFGIVTAFGGAGFAALFWEWFGRFWWPNGRGK